MLIKFVFYIVMTFYFKFSLLMDCSYASSKYELAEKASLRTFLKSVGKHDVLSSKKELDEIISLSLENTKTDDADLRHLRVLYNLESLSLFKTPINGSGLEYIVDLEKLRFLYLGHTNFSDRNIKILASMKNLEGLFIENTQITDHSLSYLIQLKNLKILNIAYNHITDVALFDIIRMENLEELNISYTKITPQGYNNLSKLMPNVRIRYWGSHEESLRNQLFIKNKKFLLNKEKKAEQPIKKIPKKEANSNIKNYYYYYIPEYEKNNNEIRTFKSRVDDSNNIYPDIPYDPHIFTEEENYK